MLKLSGCLVTALLASALALPRFADAAPQLSRGGSAPHVSAAHVAAPHVGASHFSGAPHFSGTAHFSHATPHFTAHSFAPHVGGRAFTPHFAVRHFTPQMHSHAVAHHFSHATPHFATVPHGTHLNRSALRARHLNVSHGNPVGSANANLHERALRHAHVNAQTLNHAAAATAAAQTARQGRFASRYAARAQSDPQWRSAHMAARRAWRRGERAGFVAWYGPVFWPYAYSDIFNYAFWPYGYDDGYWDYAYDDFIDGLFWGEYGPPGDYAYAEAAGPSANHLRVTYAGVQELCTQPGSGITAWPFAEIQRKVGLNGDQKQLLTDLRKAAADAAATFKASCPAQNAFPLTPPGRLTAMTGRLQATLEAVKVVQPALDKFYNALSDEQKERFNELGPKRALNAPETTASVPQAGKNCEDAKSGLVTLPMRDIADVVKPTDAQQADFKSLQDATGKAVSILQAACPSETPLTPPGRLAAMQKHLQAMIDAANTVKQPLDSFYASLSNEQKARFDRIGQVLAQAKD